MSPQTNPAVLITGASKGIGLACALRLDAMGFRVFAGFRADHDAVHLRTAASDRLVPLRLDITDESLVAGAVDTVARATGGTLWGLVNNAGIVVAGPLEAIPFDELRRQFEVNVFGTLRVTRAVLPLLRASRGRIVNISSVNGRLVTRWSAAYAASKFALEALSDGFRGELERWGIRVCVIQPGAIDTAIWDTTRERAIATAGRYDDGARRHYRRVLEMLPQVKMPARALPADRVARVVARALRVRHPRTRYRVGWDARVGVFIAQFLPGRLVSWLMGTRRRRVAHRSGERRA